MTSTGNSVDRTWYKSGSMQRTDARPSASPVSAPRRTIEKTRGHPDSQVSRLGAQGHADADLAPTLPYGVVQDAVEADAREQERDSSEEARKHGQQALADGLRVDRLLLCTHVADTEFRAAGCTAAVPARRGTVRKAAAVRAVVAAGWKKHREPSAKA